MRQKRRPPSLNMGGVPFGGSLALNMGSIPSGGSKIKADPEIDAVVFFALEIGSVDPLEMKRVAE